MPNPEKPSLFGPSRGELEALIDRLLAENAALKRMVADLHAEIAQLKGVSGKPAIKPPAQPSGMEQKTGPTRPRCRRGRAGKVPERVIGDDRILPITAPTG